MDKRKTSWQAKAKMELFGGLCKNGLLASEDTTRPSPHDDCGIPGYHQGCQVGILYANILKFGLF